MGREKWALKAYYLLREPSLEPQAQTRLRGDKDPHYSRPINHVLFGLHSKQGRQKNILMNPEVL
jgi:hypothetical protein